MSNQKGKEYLLAFDLYCKGLSQKEVSKFINVQKSTVYHWFKDWRGLTNDEIKTLIECKVKLARWGSGDNATFSTIRLMVLLFNKKHEIPPFC